MRVRFSSILDHSKNVRGDNMEKETEKPMQMERKIGNTTYIVTSHFPSEGSSAVDKIKRLIGMDTKASKYGKKV